MNDYIFCPLCGSSEWSTSKFGQTSAGKLTDYVCKECSNFQYTNITKYTNHYFDSHIMEVGRYSEVAKIKPYYIALFWPPATHGKPLTSVRDLNTLEVILSVNSLINFNWYKQDEVVNKVKKYLVFS